MNKILKQFLDTGGWETIEQVYGIELSLADRVKLKNYIEKIDPKGIFNLVKSFSNYFNEYGYHSRAISSMGKESKREEKSSATFYDLERQKIFELLEQKFNVKLADVDKEGLIDYLKRKKYDNFNELWQDAAKLLQRKVFTQERTVKAKQKKIMKKRNLPKRRIR